MATSEILSDGYRKTAAYLRAKIADYYEAESTARKRRQECEVSLDIVLDKLASMGEDIF